jgi:hypothetical protein
MLYGSPPPPPPPQTLNGFSVTMENVLRGFPQRVPAPLPSPKSATKAPNSPVTNFSLFSLQLPHERLQFEMKDVGVSLFEYHGVNTVPDFQTKPADSRLVLICRFKNGGDQR